MKKVIVGLLLLLFCFNGRGQEDTLRISNKRKVADTIFGLLNKNIYGDALIDRSLTDNPYVINQFKGNYNEIADGISWLKTYADVAISYLDSTYMMNNDSLVKKIEKIYLNYELNGEDDAVTYPFGLILHQVSKIDSTVLQNKDAFKNERCQLKLNGEINEETIYHKVMIKAACILQLTGEHGYSKCVIKYNPDFISLGQNIELISMKIDVGNGFQDFSAQHNEIAYSVYKDWQIGKVALSYQVNNENKHDTLSFYLTRNTYKFKSHERAVDRWDEKNIKFKVNNKKVLKYAIKYGCGNGTKIRRPVIIAPPYRPWIQSPSFNKYYDQFNFKSLISDLSEMGYDVIFIKETPGNKSISTAGNYLAEFIKDINDKKKTNYPNEDWENVVIGFSAGGQQWRWALKKLEKEHMEWGTPHPHTRLYVAFDSPHWGANVPMFAQATFYDYNNTWNPIAALIYDILNDDASRSMLRYHMAGSTIVNSGGEREIYPAPDVSRQNIMNDLMNAYNHQYTPMNDLRRSFPTFSRNIAVSTGNNEKDYTSEYGLQVGEQLFTQHFAIPTWYGFKYLDNALYSSRYGSSSKSLKRDEVRVYIVIPWQISHRYRTSFAYEWDEAQGGYKDIFYDGFLFSAVGILRSTAYGLGTKHYKKHMSFLPMVSALGINPDIWKDNHLYYNLKDDGLMYNKFGYNPQQDKSNTFGYPNLGHPNDHFNITPFEAIYCDPQTYEHIKMQKSVDKDNLNENYLVYLRNFILDEVEADVVYMQNKNIGQNHVQWKPYTYKAWYKAHDKIVFGDSVTPKTDVGPYVIENTGDITAYAGQAIVLKPGFHAKAGSKFHAFIWYDGCSRPRSMVSSNPEPKNQAEDNVLASFNKQNREEKEDTNTAKLKVFPNPSNGSCTVVFPLVEGKYVVLSMSGKTVKQQRVTQKKMVLRLPKGIYIIKWSNKTDLQTQKIIVL